MNYEARQKLAARIRELEGISNEEKSALLELLNTKQYGLVWENKPEDVEERLREELPVLKEDKDCSIINGEEYPNHILIEGDNLEALTVLSYTHEGKIDVIYIDPPYNTGNKDFVYNDSFVDYEDSYRHSKWLSFMSKRLRIAKQLLSNRGIIFISIDDNEQANLRLLCDEVFGEKNFVATYFWKRTSTPPALSYKVRRKLEFVLCYQKTNIPQRTFAQGYVDGGDVPLLNNGNPLGTLKFPKESVRFGISDGIYSPNPNHKIQLLDNVVVLNGTNANDFSAKGHFKWSQSNLLKEIANGTYFLIKTNQFSPRFQKSIKSTKVPSNIVDEDVNVGTNEDAQKELSEMNLEGCFDYAKPSSLIAFLSKMPFWEEKQLIVLDFFAGSGTTLHAVMQMNNEDGGNRQCILVTNNENNICREVTYERNRRVIEGYTTPKGIKIDGLKENNLRYYKTDFIPRERTMQNMRALVNASTDLLCIKEDLYEEVMTLGAIKLKPSLARLFAKGDKQMLIIYREEVVGRIVEELEKLDFKERLKIYLFSPGRYAFDDEFFSVQDKVLLCALPAAIYDAYQKVLPKRKPKVLPEFEEKHNEELNFEEGRDE